MLIRSAKQDDINQLIDLRKLLLNTGNGYYVSNSPDDQLAWQASYREWLKRNIDCNQYISVVVCCDSAKEERIVGCAIGIIDMRVPFKGCLGGYMGWVQTMVVHPDFRRNGIAEALMNYLSQWFLRNQVEKVALQSTEIAMPLYEKLGFNDSCEPLLIKSLL